MTNHPPLITLPEQPAPDLEAWLQNILANYPNTTNSLLRLAASLAQLTGIDQATPTGQSCLQQGIYLVDVLAQFSVDQETLAAAMLYHCVRHAGLTGDDIAEQLNPAVAKLINGVMKMDALQAFCEKPRQPSSQHNTDNMRKMLLAMVDDVRIVLIKLAERLVLLRNITWWPVAEKCHEAEITQEIYAPLANRLGLNQLKCELEDLALHYSKPEVYAAINSALNSTHSEQEQYVKQVITILGTELSSLGIAHKEIKGRAKHIYSIYKKMSRKSVDFSEIYDVIGFRLLVPSVEDCYAVLGHVLSLWEPITKEFDDYITKPKPNGYRSIHTAVFGPQQHIIEIQIRTFEMDKQAELGIAAHWIYKEGKPVTTGYEAKITWLRQVMDWQLEVTRTDKPNQQAYANLFDEHIYVFTPQGDVIELVKDATPLDFAYHIHTGLGHRCRGARIDGHMVQITTPLKTGQCVEIIAAKEEHPSRDWLMPSLGYLKTSRAKSKVLHWFRVQHAEENLRQGQALLEKELRRLGLKDIKHDKLAKKMHMPSTDDLFISLGRGDTTLVAVINAVQSLTASSEPEKTAKIVTSTRKTSPAGDDINILGVGNLLTNIAVCCKPIPGDAIIGYVTQGHGISIHRQDCSNLLHMLANHQQKERLIQVHWGEKIQQCYTIDLAVDAYDRPGLIRDVTQVLASENISVLGLNCITNKQHHTAHITLGVEIGDLNLLSRILARMLQLPNVTDARRV